MRPLLPLLLLTGLSLGQGRQLGYSRQLAPSPSQPVSPAERQTPLPAGFSAPGGFGDSVYPLLGDAGLDVTHYDLSLRSDPRIDSLSGRAVLSITALRDLNQISLDFAGPKVLGVKLDGQAVRHLQIGEKLLILPPRPLAAGSTFRLTVAYSGTPALHLDASDPSGLRLGWITQAGASYVLSEPDGSHTYFPCNDVPADGATYSLHLDVPGGYTAVASGVQTRQVRTKARVLSDFELNRPIPTYALTVHVGKLEVVPQPNSSGVQIRNVFPSGLPDDVKAPLKRTPEMIGVLNSWFGPFPYPVYGVAVSSDPQIPALETATLSTFPAEPEEESTVLHELAHQWYGDDVRLGDWSDVWLNEGFATYAELLWAEHLEQDTSRLIGQWYTDLQRRPARGLVATAPQQLFDSSSYLRGALTLQALRDAAGEQVFRQILKTYAARFSGKSVRTADFLALVRELGGQTAQDALQPWIEGPALPPRPGALTKP
jgi:aminopeptidase N